LENNFDVGILQDSANFLMIMGYDYHWQGGPTAGSVAPLNNNSSPSVTNSINNYSGLMNKNKLLLGVPYYGYEWPTVSAAREAATTAPGIIIQYKDIAAKVASYGRLFDSIWKTPYYIYGSYNQGHYDDIESLGYKYDLVNRGALAGIGIWALGYDGGAIELWNLLGSKFTGAAMTCGFTFVQ
jgi:spore germination protein YaaH